jgi:hypothetical protein
MCHGLAATNKRYPSKPFPKYSSIQQGEDDVEVDLVQEGNWYTITGYVQSWIGSKMERKNATSNELEASACPRRLRWALARTSASKPFHWKWANAYRPTWNVRANASSSGTWTRRKGMRPCLPSNWRTETTRTGYWNSRFYPSKLHLSIRRMFMWILY